MDRGAWRAAVHGVAESPAQLCDVDSIFRGSTGVNTATSSGLLSPTFLIRKLGLTECQSLVCPWADDVHVNARG